MSDTEEVINLVLGIVGVEVALLFVELPDGICKVSFRSRGLIDVRAVAEQFGGGGHTLAAGLTLQEPLEVGQPKVLAAVREAIESNSANPSNE